MDILSSMIAGNGVDCRVGGWCTVCSRRVLFIEDKTSNLTIHMGGSRRKLTIV